MKAYNSYFFRQLIYLFFLMCIFGAWSIFMRQDIGWDLLNYHFYNAYALIHHRLGWDLAPAQMQTYINPFFDVFNYAFITTQKPRVTAFILGSLSGITAFFLFKSAWILFSEAEQRQRIFYATLATILGMTGMAGMWQLGTTSNDTKVALFVVLALYCMLKVIISKDSVTQNSYVITAGLLLGLVTGFKLTAACYAVGLFVGFALCRYPERRNLKQLVFCMIAAIIGFVIADGYWMWTLYQHFKNPLFPYYNTFFHSPYADIGSYVDERYHPHTLFQYIFLPFYLLRSNHALPDMQTHDPRLMMVFILVILFAIVTLYRKYFYVDKVQSKFFLIPEWRFLLITFLISYLLWLIQFTIYRYAMPLEIFSGLTIVYIIQAIFNKASVRFWALLIVAAWLILNTSVVDSGGRMRFDKTYFSVDVPSLPAHSLIITTSGGAVGYLVPFFPSDSRFVGANNNFNAPGHTNLSQKAVEIIIKTYTGPMYSLTPMADKNDLSKVLHFYHLVPITSKCVTFRSNVHDEFYFCQLIKKSGAHNNAK